MILTLQALRNTMSTTLWAYGHSLPEVFLSQLLPSNLVVILLQTL